MGKSQQNSRPPVNPKFEIIPLGGSKFLLARTILEVLAQGSSPAAPDDSEKHGALFHVDPGVGRPVDIAVYWGAVLCANCGEAEDIPSLYCVMQFPRYIKDLEVTISGEITDSGASDCTYRFEDRLDISTTGLSFGQARHKQSLRAWRMRIPSIDGKNWGPVKAEIKIKGMYCDKYSDGKYDFEEIDSFICSQKQALDEGTIPRADVLWPILDGSKVPCLRPEPICRVRSEQLHQVGTNGAGRKYWPTGVEILTDRYQDYLKAGEHNIPSLKLNLDLFLLLHQAEKVEELIGSWTVTPARSTFNLNLGAELLPMWQDSTVLSSIFNSTASSLVMYEINEDADDIQFLEDVANIQRAFPAAQFGYDDSRIFGLFLRCRNLLNPGPKFVKVDNDFFAAASKNKPFKEPLWGIVIKKSWEHLSLLIRECTLGRHQIILEGIEISDDIKEVCDLMKDSHCSELFIQGWYLNPKAGKCEKECEICSVKKLPLECELPKF